MSRKPLIQTSLSVVEPLVSCESEVTVETGIREGWEKVLRKGWKSVVSVTVIITDRCGCEVMFEIGMRTEGDGADAEESFESEVSIYGSRVEKELRLRFLLDVEIRFVVAVGNPDKLRFHNGR